MSRTDGTRPSQVEMPKPESAKITKTELRQRTTSRRVRPPS